MKNHNESKMRAVMELCTLLQRGSSRSLEAPRVSIQNTYSTTNGDGSKFPHPVTNSLKIVSDPEAQLLQETTFLCIKAKSVAPFLNGVNNTCARHPCRWHAALY